MRTFFFTLFILLIVGLGAWLKWGEKVELPSFLGGKKSLSKASIAPFNEWKSILPGTWDFRKEYESPLVGCIDEGEVEYRADGTFHRYSNIKRYQDDTPATYGIFSDSYQWYTGGGNVVGNWSIDTLNGSIDEVINACGISRSWIRDRWTENGQICNTYYVLSPPLGNFKGASEKRWVERFNNDSIIVRGRDYSSDMDISIWLKKRQ